MQQSHATPETCNTTVLDRMTLSKDEILFMEKIIIDDDDKASTKKATFHELEYL